MPCLHNRPTLYTFMILIHISPKNEKGCFEKLNTIVKQDNKDFFQHLELSGCRSISNTLLNNLN